jgi:hypothetical protein
MDLGLKDKVAIVTGGSYGIGKAAAWRLAYGGPKSPYAPGAETFWTRPPRKSGPGPKG